MLLEYNVPKFGGYSNNAKLRASLMRNSYELFKHLPWTIVDSDKGNGSLKNAVNIAVAEKTVKEPVSWVGTMGIPTDELPHEVCHKISKKLEQDFSSFPVVTDDILLRVLIRTTPNRFYGPLYIIKFQIIQIQRLLKTILGTTIKK